MSWNQLLLLLLVQASACCCALPTCIVKVLPALVTPYAITTAEGCLKSMQSSTCKHSWRTVNSVQGPSTPETVHAAAPTAKRMRHAAAASLQKAGCNAMTLLFQQVRVCPDVSWAYCAR
jgi:hypothetical protein